MCLPAIQGGGKEANMPRRALATAGYLFSQKKAGATPNNAGLGGYLSSLGYATKSGAGPAAAGRNTLLGG